LLIGIIKIICPKIDKKFIYLCLYRFNFTQESIDWADFIVTTGGDGTFLMAACRIQDRQKPIVGFNTDPTRSIGYLCLPKKYSISVQDAVNKLFQNKFKWTMRRRIRITLIGKKKTRKF
jgi:NAD+ kinase